MAETAGNPEIEPTQTAEAVTKESVVLDHLEVANRAGEVAKQLEQLAEQLKEVTRQLGVVSQQVGELAKQLGGEMKQPGEVSGRDVVNTVDAVVDAVADTVANTASSVVKPKKRGAFYWKNLFSIPQYVTSL